MGRWCLLIAGLILVPLAAGAASAPSQEAYDEGVEAWEANQPEAAAEAFQRAAELGSDEAAFRLAMLYEDGEGVTQDLERAIDWYHRAAEAGNEKAQFNLGRLYARGSGVERDISEAAHWYEQSALEENPHAQFTLGLMYFHGESELERDLVAAYRWLTLAVLNFNTNHFRDNASNARDKVVEEMTAEQEEEGKRLVEEHRSR